MFEAARQRLFAAQIFLVALEALQIILLAFYSAEADFLSNHCTSLDRVNITVFSHVKELLLIILYTKEIL